jgi:hypothetical protein
MIQLSGVRSEDIPGIWDKVVPLLEKAMKHSEGEHTMDTLLETLETQNSQLWIGHEDGEIVHAGITHILIYKTGKKAAEIFYLGGSRMKEWLEHINIIESWAKAEGCTSVRIIGRKGWEKVMKDYKPLYLTLTRELT